MNRALLLIICDFLLLSMLAIARFDREEVEDTVPADEIAEAQDDVASEDLIALLQMSLESEQATREQMAEQLQSSDEELAQKEARLAQADEELEARKKKIEELKRVERAAQQLVAERKVLDAKLNQAHTHIQEERAKLDQTREELSEIEKERLALTRKLSETDEIVASKDTALNLVQENLNDKLNELKYAEARVAELEQALKQQELAKKDVEGQLQVAQTQNENLSRSVESLEEDKQRVQQMASELAEGVTVLADTSLEMKKEIEQLQPQSLNKIFENYRANKIRVQFYATKDGLLATQKKSYAMDSIIVEQDGKRYALVLSELTPFSESGVQEASGKLGIRGQYYDINEIYFHEKDSRIVLIPVPDGIDVPVMRITDDPFRFRETVVIRQDGTFGEILVKQVANVEGYMERDSKLISSLPGEVKPGEGDLLFAKTGGLMGLLLSKDYVVLIDSIQRGDSLRVGSGFQPHMHRLIQSSGKYQLETLPPELR